MKGDTDLMLKNHKKAQEIIERLSKLHNNKSTDPETLCGAIFTDYNPNHYQEISVIQSELLKICRKKKLVWTNSHYPTTLC